MNRYLYKKIEKHDFDLLIPLMQDCFGMEVDMSYFYWKYIDNPAGMVIGFIAVEEGSNQVAAYYGVIPQCYMIDGKETIIYQSCDTMTHSKHRRKGLFQQLATLCYDYLRQKGNLFVIGFGGEKSTPGFLKLEWKSIFVIKNYFFPKIFIYIPFVKCNISPKLAYLDRADLFQINHLLLKSNAFSAIHSHKREIYFKWRISNPRYNYQIIVVKNEAAILSSYACFYFDKDKIVLFDFYFENKQESALLLGEIKRVLRHENKKGIIAFCQENSYFANKLRQSGFLSNPFNRGPLSIKTPFLLLSSSNVISKINDPSCWNITAYDHDAM